MIPSTAVADLAPTGKIRAANNFGNPILATEDGATGETRGVSVDLARELGLQLAVPVQLVTFNTAGEVVDAFKTGTVDVGFVAIDPARAVDISYTEAYVVIGRDAGAQYLRDFLATMKSSGFVAEALKRHGIEGAAVAP